MMRERFCVAGLLGTILSMPVLAQSTPENLCRRPEVLELIQRHYGSQAAHFEIVGNTATEVRNSGGFVVCGVTVQVVSNDATELQPRYFQLQVLDGGLRVDFGETSRGPVVLDGNQR